MLKGCDASTSRPHSSKASGVWELAEAQLYIASENFEHAGCAHDAEDAHRDDDLLGAAALAFDEGVAREALAAHAVGVAHRDGAAVDVQAVIRDAQLVAAVQ